VFRKMSERKIINCEVCHSFLHETKDCIYYERLKTLIQDVRTTGLIEGRKQGAVEELELDISWLKDLEDYAYLFGHKGEMLNRITMRKEYQNKRLKELKED
jgi:hypothetical protein